MSKPSVDAHSAQKCEFQAGRRIGLTLSRRVALLLVWVILAQAALGGPATALSAPSSVSVALSGGAGVQTIGVQAAEKTEPIPPAKTGRPAAFDGPPRTEAGPGQPSGGAVAPSGAPQTPSKPDRPEPRTETGPGRLTPSEPPSSDPKPATGAPVTPSAGPDSSRARSGPFTRTVDPGQQTTYSISFENNGTSTWRSSENVTLRQNGNLFGNLGGCNNLPPGGVCSWGYTHTAGQTPGTSILDFRMYRGDTAFGETIRVTLTVRGSASDGATARSGPHTRTLDPGQQTTYEITFENTGGTTWRSSDGYVLRENGNASGGLGGCDNLPTGSRCSWTYIFTAGSTPGMHTFSYRMYHGGNAFGDTIQVSITIRDLQTGDDSSARSGPHTRTLDPGDQTTVDIAFQNTDVTTWRSAEGYILRENGGSSTPLGNCDALAPGATCTWLFTLTAGATPGAFTYDYQLYHNTVPFGDAIRVTITVRQTPPPANDAFNGAQSLGLPMIVSDTTSGAGTESGEPKPPCLTSSATFGKSIWYRVSPGTNGTMTLTTAGSAFDTVLALYTGSSVSALTPVQNGCNDDEDRTVGLTTSRVTVPVTAGQVYYAQLSGFGGSGGAYTLQATLDPYRTLRVTKAGAGGGTVGGPGVSCGSDCTETFPSSTSVTLTAAPDGNSAFAGWGGACSGAGSCVLSMSGDKEVTATFHSLFTSNCPNRPPIRVSVSPTGDGRLLATIQPGQGLLRLIRLGAPNRPLRNAVVDVVGGASSLTTGQTIDLGAGVGQAQFYVRRIAAGPMTVPLFVFDDCGSWQTLIGAGS